MNNHVTFQQCLAALDANRLRYGRLDLQNGLTVVITEYGGRILGPFLGMEGESLFWTHAALAQPDALRDLAAARAWNLGGDRIWIGPEIQYNIRDRADFWGSYALSPQMDPGDYTLTQLAGDAWRLQQTVTLDAFNLARGTKTLHVDRVIRPVADPLRHLAAYADLIQDVVYGGYEHAVTLTDAHPDAILSETWNLVQVNPGGRLYIPVTPAVEVTDYFEPVGDALQRRRGAVELAISGRRRYKIGLQAVQVYGRAAYVNPLADGAVLLIVRAFFCNPSAPYLEEPAHLPGKRGHAIHVYNDDGDLGGFGEIESQGQAIGGTLGRPATMDPYLTWVYMGSRAKIDAILEQLVGISVIDEH